MNSIENFLFPEIKENPNYRDPNKARARTSVGMKPVENTLKPLPLPNSFFTHLIKLEVEYSNKTYTVQTLDDLIECYGDAVEYYDSIKDHVSSYFMFKIQDVLTAKKSIKILKQETSRASSLNSPMVRGEVGSSESRTSLDTPKADSSPKINLHDIRPSPSNFMVIKELNAENSSDEVSDDEDTINFVKKKKLMMCKIQQARPRKQSIASIKNHKQKMFGFQLKLQDVKDTNKQNLSEIMETYTETSKIHDEIVKANLDSQRNQFKERIAAKTKQLLLKKAVPGPDDNRKSQFIEQTLAKFCETKSTSKQDQGSPSNGSLASNSSTSTEENLVRHSDVLSNE